MAAPISNTNAEVWTLQRTLATLKSIEAFAAEDHILTLSTALLRARCYKQLWSYWKKKWELNAEVMDTIYFIEQMFIVKTEVAALSNDMHPSACFFILKYNYGFGTNKADEIPSYLEAEFEQEEEKKPNSTKKETAHQTADPFSPRSTDDSESARLREDARMNPHLYTTTPPEGQEYIMVGEDLYMVA